MKKSIFLIIMIFIASSVLIGDESSIRETKKPETKFKRGGLKNKFNDKKPSEKNIVKPMKKKRLKPREVQDQLEKLRLAHEDEKFEIMNNYKKELQDLKRRKKEALRELKADYKKKRSELKKK